MKNSIRKTLLGAVLVSVVGLAGCGEQSVREVGNWIGPVLTRYQDKNRDGKIDNVRVNFVSSFTAGCMGYDRSPTEVEVRNSEDIFKKYNKPLTSSLEK